MVGTQCPAGRGASSRPCPWRQGRIPLSTLTPGRGREDPELGSRDGPVTARGGCRALSVAGWALGWGHSEGEALESSRTLSPGQKSPGGRREPQSGEAGRGLGSRGAAGRLGWAAAAPGPPTGEATAPPALSGRRCRRISATHPEPLASQGRCPQAGCQRAPSLLDATTYTPSPLWWVEGA